MKVKYQSNSGLLCDTEEEALKFDRLDKEREKFDKAFDKELAYYWIGNSSKPRSDEAKTLVWIRWESIKKLAELAEKLQEFVDE